MANSPVEKLLSENPKLLELDPPFRGYYPYHSLRNLLKNKLECFLNEEAPYVDSMELFLMIKKEKVRFSAPYKAADFLHHLNPKKGQAVDLFTKFFNYIIAAPNCKSDRQKKQKFDFTPIDALCYSTGLGTHSDSVLGATVVSAFFRKAQRCEEVNNEKTHTSQKFLDLFSIFCGYNNFESFLNTKFGPHYRKEEDLDLQDLILNYRGKTELAPKIKQTPKFETTTELVSKSIHKPEYLIGRDGDLAKISDILESKRKVAVIGEGGMGKTSAAAALYHNAMERRSYTHVAWLFCEHGTISALIETALGLGKNLEGLQTEEKLAIINHALKEKGKNLLLVLDNVENDLDDFFQAFQGFDGHVLITSRSSFGWEGLEEHRLPALSTEDAKTLFRTHYSWKKGPLESGAEFEELLDQLISAIGYNTLLIELFAKLLRQDFSDTSGSEYGIRQFLNKLKEEGLYLAPSNGEVKTNYSFHRRKKVATIPDILDILYDFSKLDEATRHLLVNLSLLPAQEFSDKELLEIFVPTDQLEFRRTLSKLFSQGWIGGEGRTVYKLSPVVKEMTIRKNKNTLWVDVRSLIEKISYLIKNDEEEDNTHLKYKWLKIAESISANIEFYGEIEFISFMNRLGWLLITKDGAESKFHALAILEKTLESSIKVLKNDSLLIAECRTNLAAALYNIDGKDNLERAKLELYLAFNIYNNTPNENLSPIGNCFSLMGLIFKKLGGEKNLKVAWEFSERALAFEIEANSENSKKVPKHLSNLAMVLYDIGGSENLTFAKTLMEKAVTTSLKYYGEGSPTVAVARSNLASILKEFGDYNYLECAIDLLDKALTSDITNFGKDSVVVARRRSNLAIVLQKSGSIENINRAIGELRNSLSCNSKSLGEDSDVVISDRSRLALALVELGGRDNLICAAEELETRTSSLSRKFGEDAPVVVENRTQRIMVLILLGDKDFLEMALVEVEKALFTNHRHFKEDINGFADFLLNLTHMMVDLARILLDLRMIENLNRLSILFEKSQTMLDEIFSVQIIDILMLSSAYALILKRLGTKNSLELAIKILEKALAFALKTMVPDCLQLAILRINLAAVLMDLKSPKNLGYASELLKEAITARQTNFEEDGSLMVILYRNLATILIDMGGQVKLLESLELLIEARQLAIQHFGEEHPNTIAIAKLLDKVKKALEDL